ncbi:NitT/TauT family transport system substrate-binding protein [Rhizobium sp. BK529]|uniref:ABC transporter substrate-binding protein n=1 Tax=unclassified Rhizobium TaxID=2613769 RepID=UPI001052FAA6|nr:MULTISPECIES: ABC transporter substrate-binding protein [unclassified Rhizobium]MBB3593761.1 NitT/TauT family transport system substrate-binding protein [Rhizobium sp. BK529]TCR96021.1 NitT/TauT family transport system substrate-binding protein [Rhizobium sp. BK418]
MNRLILSAAVAASLLFGCLEASAADLVTVNVGIANSSSDVAFFIADKKGYFREEGIDAKFVPFDSGAKMVAPLGAGQLDVAGGSPSAGLYNAVARGIGIKIVADKGSTPPGYGYQPLLIRKDLIDSGKFKTLADLKGLKVAGSANGSASTSTMNEALKKAGLKPADVERLYLGFPQHVLALENKAVDAALTTEPSATEAVRRGAAVRFMGDDEIYPNHQLAVVLYSNTFAEQHHDVAEAFMRAYIRAARDYNNALSNGKLAGPNANEVVSILTEYTSVKDPETFRTIVPQGTNPDGKLNVESLKTDLAYFKSEGLMEGEVSLDKVVDTSFAEDAVKKLGPYQPQK